MNQQAVLDRYEEYEFTDKDGDVFRAFVDHNYPLEDQLEYLKTVYEAVSLEPSGPMRLDKGE